MQRCLLLKYGELILKGANRRYFEEVLLRRVRKKLEPLGEFRVCVMQSTIFVDCDDDALLDRAAAELKKVFGIISLTVAYKVEKTEEAILRGAAEYLAPAVAPYRSFKCDARRSDKKFPLSSPDLCRLCGGKILEALSGKSRVKVDVRDPEIVAWIEIRDDAAYLHAGAEKGAGGMPYGTGGRVMLLLSGGIDSPVAGYSIAKRGAEVDAVHFESFPYTSERAREKVFALASKLCAYTGTVNLAVISVTKIQLELKRACREDLFTLLLRRSMMRLASRAARHQGCAALVTGESLGQVASQTLEALACTENAASLPVLRPLIGLDKEEIVAKSRAIDCFETSILPYEDCCTVFTPRHPKLHPSLEELEAQEQKLDLAALEDEAFAGIHYRKVTENL